MKAILLAVAFLLLCSGRALGCQCLPNASPGYAYKRSDAVFIGHATRTTYSNKGDNAEKSEQIVWVQIEKIYKGLTDYGEIPIIYSPNDKEPETFGVSRLYYAILDKGSGTFLIHLCCNRGGRIESVSDDLLFLNALPQSAQRPRIAGEIILNDEPLKKGEDKFQRLAGIWVNIVGKKRSVRIQTNDDGVYEVYDLPPGHYEINPELPDGLKIRYQSLLGSGNRTDEDQLGLDLAPNANIGRDFILANDSKLSGTIFAANGKPADDAGIKAIPVADTDNPLFSFYAYTKRDGKYSLEMLPVGSYYLVVVSDVFSDDLTGAIYYPGVLTKENAIVINVLSGSKTDNLDVRLPVRSKKSKK